MMTPNNGREKCMPRPKLKKSRGVTPLRKTLADSEEISIEACSSSPISQIRTVTTHQGDGPTGDPISIVCLVGPQ